jgi:hypothetical protein
MAVVAAVSAAVTVAAGVYGAVAKKAAADKAAVAQNRALTKSERVLNDELNLNKVNDAFLRAERARLDNRKALQEEFDPELARVRELGAKQILAEAEKDPASLDSSRTVRAIMDENLKEDPRLKTLRDNLLTRGIAESTAGATLSPEYQAELVRAGLTGTAGSGISQGKAQVGGSVARVLGRAGVDLQAQRDQTAQQIAGTVGNLDRNRARILESVFPAVAQQEQNLRVRGAQNMSFADQMAPEGGLTGKEGANLQIQRGQTLINFRQKKGQIAAQKAIAAGDANAAMAKSIGSGVSSVVGAAGAAGAFGPFGSGGSGGSGGGADNSISWASSAPSSGGGYGPN